MKTWDRAMIFWGAASVFAAAALEWLLILGSVRMTRLAPVLWLLPLVLFPFLAGMTWFIGWRAKPREQRLLLLKYLSVYLPWIAGPIAFNLYGGLWGLWGQLIAVAIALPFQILVPLWYSKKAKRLEQHEREHQVVAG